MGTGYTRNDTANNIADGNVIDAADLDGEFDAVEAAFNSSTGHTHDGTSAEGGAITVLGPSQEFVATANEVRPSTNGGLSLGTNLVQFNNLYASGTISLGTSTFSDDVTFTGTNYNVVWDKSQDSLEFADNAMAKFGNGGDLQIYHDGSQSIIHDNGTGPLRIRTPQFRVHNGAQNENMIIADENGAVTLYYDNAAKIATTSTGISVTDDIDVANNIIMSSDAANISFGADSEIYIKHVADTGLALENTNTGDSQSFVLNLKSNEDTLTVGEQIARINFSTNSSAGGVSVGTQASIRVEATGTYSSTVAGSTMEFYTTDTAGTNTRAMYIDDDQSVHFTGPSANVVLDATNDTLDFPDNFKIMVGNGDDLQIYHDGSDSYIDDAGAGTLKIRSNGTGIDFESSTGESLAQFVTNGAAKLYYNNAERLATTNAGLTFTGNTFNFNGTNSDTTLTLQSTNADGNDGPILKLLRNSSSPAADDDIGRIDFNGKDSGGNELVYSRIESYIEDPTAAAQYGRTRMLIKSNASLLNFMDLDASSGGAAGRVGFNIGQQDIDFVVRSTGDASLFTVDASTNNIGIGTGTPASILHINHNTPTVIIDDANNGTGGTSYRPHIQFNANGTEVGSVGMSGNQYLQIKTEDYNSAGIIFSTAGTERARLNAAGNLGIGETSPTAPLHINTSNVGSANPNLIVETDSGNASVGPEVHIIRSSITPANDDPGGIIRFYANDDAGAAKQTGYIYSQISDVTASNFGGKITYAVNGSNNMENAMVLYPASTVFNEGSVDRDFRVESNANTHMLFVDAGNNRIGINEDNPEEILHIRGDAANDVKILIENETNPRGNYIGVEGADELVLAADEDNLGTSSMIRFRVDASEKMRITDNGKLLINKTVEQPATNAPPTFIEAHDATGASMLLSRSDSTVSAGNNIGAYLFRTGDSSGVKYGGMVSRGRNTTGDGYLGFYSVDNRLQVGSSPDLTILENMNTYLRNGTFVIGYDILANSYVTNEDAFLVYHNGSGTGDTYVEMRVRDGTGSDHVWRHFRRGTLKSEIEENGDFMSATNSYGGTSDERLKENIVASGSQWDDVKALQVKKYSWIEENLDAPNQLGVIAQDLMASGMNGLVQQHFKTAPNPETQEHEPVLDADGNQEEFYTVKYSVLYMKAIKALQEAMERIETLEAKVTALENS
jgi:hypothetical protein